MNNVNSNHSHLDVLRQSFNSNCSDGGWSCLSKIQSLCPTIVPVAVFGIGAFGIYGCMRSPAISNFLIWIGLKANPVKKAEIAAQEIEKVLENIGSGLADSLRDGLIYEQSVQREVDRHNEKAQAIESIKKEVHAYLNDGTKTQFEIEFPKDGNKSYPDGKQTYKSRKDFFKATQISGEVGQFINEMIRQYKDDYCIIHSSRVNEFINYYPADRKESWWKNFWPFC